MLNERIEIEEQIIGTMLNGFYLTALDILKPQNFEGLLHRQIFEIIQKHHLTEPIDLVNVTRLYNKAHKPPMTYLLTELCNKLIPRSVGKYCLILLELDIRDKFGELLGGYESASVLEEDFPSAKTWKDCRDHITHPDHDVFKAVDKIYSYIKHVKPDEVDEYAELMTAIPKLIDRIKRQVQVSHLIDSLRAHCFDQGSREDMLKITADIFLTLLVQPDIPADLRNYLHHIHDHILCQSPA